MDFSDVNKLPSTTGVYFFKKADVILYIGKSVNIKARVKSHIENSKIDHKEALIIETADNLDFIVTDSEFKAILLEADLIKKHHPKYNVIWQDNKSFLYIKITVGDLYPKIFLSRFENDKRSRYFGPFSSIRTATNILREIRRIIPFCMQKNIKARPCFYAKIGLCSPCPSAIIRLKDLGQQKQLKKLYRKNIRKVIRILQGKSDIILRNFYHELNKLSKEKDYENAILLRDKIIRFERLLRRQSFDLDTANINRSEEALKILLGLMNLYFPDLKSLERIEGYDISNFQSKNATSSMVVLSNGLIDRSQYRRFKIHSLKAKSDFEMLEEILHRRFRRKISGWPLPNLIVVDGGTPQVRLLMKVLNEMKINVPIIGIAKNPDRLVIGLKGFPSVRPANNNLGFNLIQQLRDESHRFAHKYHLLLRRRELLL